MNPENRTLFLHIGWHKTGTTSIQSFLRSNRETLEQNAGFYYPRTGQRGDAHHVLAKSIIGHSPADPAPWQTLANELTETSDWKTAVISSENLHRASDTELELISNTLAGDWRLRAICYLRRPDECLESLFAEIIKSGQFDGSWADFDAGANHPRLYLDVIRRWRNQLGEDAVVVRPFDQSAWKGGDLYIDFFESIGLPGAEQEAGIVIPARSNARPDTVTLSVLRETARHLGTNGTEHPLGFLKFHLCEPILRNLERADKGRAPARFFSMAERVALRTELEPALSELGIEFASAGELPDAPEYSGLPELDDVAPSALKETLMAGVVELTSELIAIRHPPTENAQTSPAKKMTRPAPRPAAIADPAFRPLLYVHIGHGKTGSTTLQQTLRDNIDAVRSAGLLVADRDLLFPETGPLWEHPLKVFKRLLWNTPPEAARAELRQILGDLRNRLAAGGYRGAVISSENLSDTSSGADLFAGVEDEFEIHTIYYVRRQDEWIESAWKQWGLKQGDTIGDYANAQIEKGKPDYLTCARAWEKISASIRVVPLNGIPDLVENFWSALALGDSPPRPTSRHNQTFDWSILDVLSSNPQLFSDPHDNRIFQTLQNLLPDDAAQRGGGLLSTKFCGKIVDACRDANARLQAEFTPAYRALHDYPKKSDDGAGREDWGSPAAIQRFLGFQLLMLGTLDRRLSALEHGAEGSADAGAPSSKRLGKLKEKLATVEAENKELRKQTKFLIRKVDEIEAKMARSLIWRVKKFFLVTPK